MSNGKIYDVNSLDRLIKEFSGQFEKEKILLTESKQIGDAVYDADTVVGGGMFIEQQLRQIAPMILKQVYPDLVGLEFIKNIDNSGTYMQAIVQRIESYKGDFVNTNEISTDNGLLSFERDGKVVNIETLRGHSVYNNITEKRARMLGENIDSSLLKVHNVKYKQFIDKMIFKGIYDNRGINIISGIANYSDYISELKVESDATFATYASTKDGLGMYGEIAKLYAKIIGASAGASQFNPDTIIVPPYQYSLMATTPITVAGGNGVALDTVLTYTERNLGVKVYASKWMKGTGDAGSDRLVMLAAKETSNPNMTLYIPMPLQFLPLFIQAGDYHIHSQFRVAGMSINFNNSIGYLDKI